MKIKTLDNQSSDFSAYAEMMIESLKKVPTKPPTTTQCESTNKIIARDPSMDELHSKRSIDLVAAFADHTIERKISPQEYESYKSMQRNSKNFLGSSELSATTKERREKAVDAFLYTPPAPLNQVDIEKLTQLDRIKELSGMPKNINSKESFREWFLKFFKREQEINTPQSFAQKNPELANEFKIKGKK